MESSSPDIDRLREAVIEAARVHVQYHGSLLARADVEKALAALDAAPKEEPSWVTIDEKRIREVLRPHIEELDDAAPKEEPSGAFTADQESRIRDIRNTTVDPLTERVCALEARALPPDQIEKIRDWYNRIVRESQRTSAPAMPPAAREPEGMTDAVWAKHAHMDEGCYYLNLGEFRNAAREIREEGIVEGLEMARARCPELGWKESAVWLARLIDERRASKGGGA